MKKNYDEKKLIDYGFKKNNNYYEYNYSINNDLYATFIIDKDISIKVLENNTNLEYLPYKMINANGEYISGIREKVDSIKKDIINNCFYNNDIVEDIKKYLLNLDTYIEYPFAKTPECFTMKCKSNNKWFGIYMRITYKQLGYSNDNPVDIINLKLEPSEIEELIDNEHYFKAYHMNKKYWMSIVLDYNTDKDKLYELINKAYDIVNKK